MQMPPLNDLYAATHSRNHGIESVFLDAQFERERFDTLLLEGMPGYGAVVILSSTQSFQSDVALLGKLKACNPQLKTILFGSHPTFMPNYCLSSPAVDYIVMREPEDTIRELLQSIDAGNGHEGIPGIGYRDADNAVRITPPRPFMNMDDLPIPDRSLLPPRVDYFNPVVKKMPYTTIQTSRGCPGKCIFCTAPEFYGNKIRCRSTDRVLDELHEIKKLGYREVFFRDETFTAYKKRNLEICGRMVQDKLNLSWIANGRVDLVDREAMSAMKKAGCHMIKFGVETSSDALLKTYRKNTTAEQARQAFAYAKEVGLDTHAHLVIGGPGESEKTIADTIAFVKEIAPTTASFGILTPYAGTKLFEDVAQDHPEIRDGSASNMSNLHVSGFYSESVCGISGDILAKWLTRCYRSFYLRPGYIWNRLRGIESYDELMTLIVAGTNIFQFSLSGKK
jgi:radical SAM superfamily enzyme YgiQ (UPF0313 family)